MVSVVNDNNQKQLNIFNLTLMNCTFKTMKHFEAKVALCLAIRDWDFSEMCKLIPIIHFMVDFAEDLHFPCIDDYYKSKDNRELIRETLESLRDGKAR